MLLTIAVVLLVLWFLGVLGLYELGKAVHVLLLVGGMLLLLSVVKARDQALKAAPRSDGGSPRQ